MGVVLKVHEKELCSAARVEFSYSRLQTIRACIQLLFALRLSNIKSKYIMSWRVKESGGEDIEVMECQKSLTEKQQKEAFKKTVKLFQDDKKFYEPDYDLFSDDREFPPELGIELYSIWRGIDAFINHSDHGGYHSVGECVDIRLLFAFIGRYFFDMEGPMKGDLLALDELYRIAEDEKKVVLFC